jgi:hypothetical protein
MTVEVEAHHGGLGTSGESVKRSERLARGLRAQIVRLALAAGPRGLTINEAGWQIRNHKNNSVSPRFSELVKRGALVRVLVGYGRRTKRFPKGIPRYITRYDEETRRNVNVHWVPKFAPAAPDNSPAPNERTLEPKAKTIVKESGGREGAHV